ncbi:unnamed protein product [Ilex paraguariensis]|uniref:Uncharacterized protein n=1 Tax=Ilex paraguariensis TaxID=185542 RepID=A0ABC8SQH0_9AQUA
MVRRHLRATEALRVRLRRFMRDWMRAEAVARELSPRERSVERGCTGVQSQEDIGQASVTEKLHRQTPIGVVEGRVPWAPLVRGRTEYKGGTEGEATGIMGVVEHGGGTDSIGGQAPIGTFEAGAPGILELGSTSALYQGTMGNLKRVGSQSGRADCGSNPMLLSVRQELTVVREASIGTGHNQAGTQAVLMGTRRSQVASHVVGSLSLGEVKYGGGGR